MRTGTPMDWPLELSSTAFHNHGSIPRKYTGDGDDISPPLEWRGVPTQAKSFALIVDDPDAPDPRAPQRTWVHWILYDIPAQARGLPADVEGLGLPTGTLTGVNDWQRHNYGGPAPPIGRHRYFHKLYALDVVLPDLGRPTKAQLLNAMQGHILAETELVGTYQSS